MRNTEKLKPGWKVIKFEDIAENIAKRLSPANAETDIYVGLEHLDTESLKLRKWGHPSDVSGEKLEFKKGDIIFGRRRAYQRKLAVAEFDGICSAHALVLRAKPEMVHPDFFPFFLQSDMFMERAIEISVGSLSPTINWKTLRVQEFPLPPLDEQRRIAEILWAVDEAVETKMSALNNAVLTAEVLSAHILREGFANTKLKDSIVGKIPYDWSVVHLNDVADVRYGITLNSKRKNTSSMRPYLRVANVQRGYLELVDIRYISCIESESIQYVLINEDILVVEGHADVNEIGRAAIWKSEIRNCLHQNHLLRVRCGKEIIPQFALAWLNSPRGKSYFKRMAQSTSGLNTINSTVLKKLPIPLPSIEEQKQVIGHIVILNKSIQKLDNNILLAESMQKQISRDALSNKNNEATHV